MVAAIFAAIGSRILGGSAQQSVVGQGSGGDWFAPRLTIEGRPALLISAASGALAQRLSAKLTRAWTATSQFGQRVSLPPEAPLLAETCQPALLSGARRIL